MIMLPGWPEDIHYEPEQLKRLVRARHLEPVTAKKALIGKTWKIAGSEPEPYKVSFKSCTCPDFIKRRMPCKHMYYIAMREGFSDTDPGLKPVCDRAFDPAKELERLRELFHSGDVTREQFAALGAVLIELETVFDYPGTVVKARGRKFQPKKEENRYKDMYMHGDIDLDSFVSLSEAFRILRSYDERKKSLGSRVATAVRDIADRAKGLRADIPPSPKDD